MGLKGASEIGNLQQTVSLLEKILEQLVEISRQLAWQNETIYKERS